MDDLKLLFEKHFGSKLKVSADRLKLNKNFRKFLIPVVAVGLIINANLNKNVKEENTRLASQDDAREACESWKRRQDKILAKSGKYYHILNGCASSPESRHYWYRELRYSITGFGDNLKECEEERLSRLRQYNIKTKFDEKWYAEHGSEKGLLYFSKSYKLPLSKYKKIVKLQALRNDIDTLGKSGQMISFKQCDWWIMMKKIHESGKFWKISEYSHAKSFAMKNGYKDKDFILYEISIYPKKRFYY